MKKTFPFLLLISILALILIVSCGGKAAKVPGSVTTAPPPPQISYVPPPPLPTSPPPPPQQQAYVPPPPTDWRFEKDGIKLHLKGDPKLNLFQGDPHTLLICVYNLKDPNAFNQLMDEKEGVTKLLECSRFDPSVTSSKRIVLQPGQEVNESMDRGEGAKYVSLVAGYFNLKKEKISRLYPIQIREESQGVRSQFSLPAVLNLDLYLGPQEIQDSKGN